MWAVAAQPRTGLTPMMPTPSVDSGIARADLTSKLLLRAVDESALCQGSPSPGSDRYDCLVDEYVQVHGRVQGIRRYAKDSRMSGASSGGSGPCSTRTISCSAVSIWLVNGRFLHRLALEAEDLVNEDDGDAAGHELAVDDEGLVNAAGPA